MFKNGKLIVAIATAAAFAVPAFAQTSKTPATGEEAKISQPSTTASKGGEKAAKPVSATQEKLNVRTGNETRDLNPTFKKKTEADKAAAKADKKAKRIPPTKEEQAKAAKTLPGG